ncbi:inorganic diphosphatase [Magnetococcales bacterium HHB-1]
MQGIFKPINLFTDLPLQAADGVFHAIIEIPKNSRIKYEFNEKFNHIVVDRLFRTPVNYPQNYGFFPQAWNEFDGDPPDVIVISSEVFHPGVIVPVRVIGIIELMDTGELDHKILAVPTGASDYSHCHDIRDLDKEVVENLKWFLTHYKYRELGETLEVLGVRGKNRAEEFLATCSKEFIKRKKAIDAEEKEKKRLQKLRELELRRGAIKTDESEADPFKDIEKEEIEIYGMGLKEGKKYTPEKETKIEKELKEEAEKEAKRAAEKEKSHKAEKEAKRAAAKEEAKARKAAAKEAKRAAEKARKAAKKAAKNSA